jgi:hypothetical protein
MTFLGIRRTDHSRERLIGVCDERTADELDVYLLGRRKSHDPPAFLRLINDKRR